MDKPKPDKIRIAVALIVWHGCVLVQKRSKGGHLSGYWEFPGGKIISGETPLEGAVREAWEETGIRLNGLIPAWGKSIDYQYPEKTLKLHFFCFRLKDKTRVFSNTLVWLEITKLSALKMPPANHTVINRLIREREDLG